MKTIKFQKSYMSLCGNGYHSSNLRRVGGKVFRGVMKMSHIDGKILFEASISN